MNVEVPITDWKDNYRLATWIVQLTPNLQNGLSKNSSADCFQAPSVFQVRLIKKLGTIDNTTFEEIKDALKKVFSISNKKGI